MTTVTSSKTDSQIKSDVLNELKWDHNVDETEVGIQVRNGIVTLTGSVPAYGKRMAARNAAHRVWGVLDVVDELKVVIPRGRERTDRDLAEAVRHALRWDVFVPEDRITTTVSDSAVTLQGKVTSLTQRQEAERAVQRLSGVRMVINHITIDGPLVSSASLKRSVEDTLERQAHLEAKRLNVTVQDGVVTLSGTVRSWGEKKVVEQSIASAPGVRRVENHTVVDPYHN